MKSCTLLVFIIIGIQVQCTQEDASINVTSHEQFNLTSSTVAQTQSFLMFPRTMEVSRTMSASFQVFATPASNSTVSYAATPTPSFVNNVFATTSANTSSANISSNATMTTAHAPKVKRRLSPLQLSVLKMIRTEKHIRIVDFCFATISFLILVFLTKLPKSSKFFIHKQLIFAIAMNDLNVGILANDDVRATYIKNKDICTFVTIVHYFWGMVLFGWMAVEGINICLMLVEVFDTRSKRKKHLLYALIAYGSAVTITTVAVPVFWKSGFVNSYKFIVIAIDGLIEAQTSSSKESYSIEKICYSVKAWIVKGPVAAYLIISTLAFFYVIGLTIKRILKSEKYEGGYAKFIGTVRSFLVLYPVLGVGFVLGFFLQIDILVFGYMYIVFNGVIGTLFFIFHVVLDLQVKEAFMITTGMKKRRASSTMATSRSRASTSTHSIATVKSSCGSKDSLKESQYSNGNKLNTAL